jgi:hypothetical protein
MWAKIKHEIRLFNNNFQCFQMTLFDLKGCLIHSAILAQWLMRKEIKTIEFELFYHWLSVFEIIKNK